MPGRLLPDREPAACFEHRARALYEADLADRGAVPCSRRTGRYVRAGRPVASRFVQNARMAAYLVNASAVARARQLIDARQYVLESEWGKVQPSTDAENAFLEIHSWDDYAEWHLGLTEGTTEHTKARYGFVYGDFRRVHRMGLIACQYRAAEWRHKEIELVAHDLLQRLDAKST